MSRVTCREGYVESTISELSCFQTFDSETMPDWFGMPSDSDLTSTFTIEYVRAWKRAQKK